MDFKFFRQKKKREGESEGMELQHFSHDHPLILLKTEHMEDEKVCCYGCALPISVGNESSYYGCIKCWYFLHKSCAQLPEHITHPFHPDHPLSLLFSPPENKMCDLCLNYLSRFIYRCSKCDFDVDMNCASMLCGMQQKIEHKSHSSYPLTPLQKPAIFLCDACGEKHEEGASYLCKACGFWVNQKCANSWPTTIKLNSHYPHHPLTLMYSIPQKYFKHIPFCKICDGPVYRRNWVYYCSDSECSPYFVHVNCVTSSEIEHSRNCNKLNSEIARDYELEVNKEQVLKAVADAISLPVSDDSVDLITQFIKGMRVEEAKYNKATEMRRHASHEHPLIFCDNRIDHDTSNLNDAKCNGCAQSIISAPFYHCAQCNFLLHEWCAELPDKIQHPCHLQHPLLLATDFYTIHCRCCRLDCNSFKYGCSACNFFVDIKCASLPRKIKHEAHDDILALRPTRSCHCSICRGYCELAFVCDPCNLNLCVWCTVLPRKVRHRYDEQHPFILTYSPPFKDWTEGDNYEDFCEICLQDINPKFWFYHCAICDQSLHISCIGPIDESSNIKYGVSFNIEQHPHPLTYVRTQKNQSPCGVCRGKNWRYYSNPTLECMTCNLLFHYTCVLKTRQPNLMKIHS